MPVPTYCSLRCANGALRRRRRLGFRRLQRNDVRVRLLLGRHAVMTAWRNVVTMLPATAPARHRRDRAVGRVYNFNFNRFGSSAAGCYVAVVTDDGVEPRGDVRAREDAACGPWSGTG